MVHTLQEGIHHIEHTCELFPRTSGEYLIFPLFHLIFPYFFSCHSETLFLPRLTGYQQSRYNYKEKKTSFTKECTDGNKC